MEIGSTVNEEIIRFPALTAELVMLERAVIAMTSSAENFARTVSTELLRVDRSHFLAAVPRPSRPLAAPSRSKPCLSCLAYQWMTTEVLTSTLKDYADESTEIGKKAFAAAQDVKTFSQLMDTLKESAQSGWAETWQLIVGDYEEAKVRFHPSSSAQSPCRQRPAP